MREYLLTVLVTAAVTYLLTPLVRRLAVAVGAMHAARDRDVHVVPIPLLGGLAMYGGLAVGLLVAAQIEPLRSVFSGSRMESGLLLAGGLIVLVGFADDRWGLNPLSKLAGQVAAGAVLVWSGAQVSWLPEPGGATLVLTQDQATTLTILVVVATINAVNFIDGLDGLAAGIVAIGAGAFFVYSHQLGVVDNIQASNAGPLIAVIAIGLCVGFLPHNFHPAKIFMGDAGSMLLGVLVAASTLAVVGQDSYQFSGRTYFFFAPIIIPFFILGIPLLDTVFAIVRRAGQRTSPAVADLSHLHHRLMRLGHGHRAAVLILWAWTALLSGLVLWPGVTDSHNEIPPIAVGALAILLYTLFAPRGRSALSNGDNDGHAVNGTNGHGSQPPRVGPGSRVTAPTPKIGASRRGVVGKPPSPVPARGVVATGGLRSGPVRPGAQNPRSSNGVRLVLPDGPTPPAGQPTTATPVLGTPKTVAPGPPVPEGL